MQWQKVESSQIAEVGYDTGTGTLGIRFHPGKRSPASEYTYDNVSADLHRSLVTAESVGSFFAQNIKPFPDKYPYRKVSNGAQVPSAGIKVEIDTPGSALAKIDGITVTEMFTPGFMDPILAAVRTEVMSQAAKLDISTEENRKAIASIAYRVAKSKTFVDAQRKSYVGEQKKKLAAIDAVGAQIWTVLEGIQREVRQPLTEWEDKETARVKAHEDAVAEIWAMKPHLYPDIPSLEAAIKTLEAIKPDTFEEFKAPAMGARAETLDILRGELETRRKAAADQEELERLRAESSERARQDEIEAAANRARESAEKAQREAEARAEEAQKRLESEQQAAARRAEEAAAESKRAAERAVEAERERVAAEERAAQEAAEARAANIAHRNTINAEIERSLIDLDLSPELAERVVAAIANDKVPYVHIDY
jgi:hypothetical protein